MNKKLQDIVAKQYESAGFKTLAGEIRKSSGASGIRKIAMNMIAQLIDLDPSGFGQDIKDISKAGGRTNG